MLRDTKCRGERVASTGNAHRQFAESPHERGTNSRGLAHHLDGLEAAQDLFPEDFQLRLGKPVTDTTVDAEAKGQVLARSGTVDHEAVRFGNGGFVSIAG